ncbi:endonuclease domain-containing protein [Cyanobacterium aponinum]|uniref:endonuclease domain-containing protein n=1 Tax=Cyanobacterium aponinum TaxID=379064 RepID=UPI000C12C5A0|nr:endonuclease domain-containing protein [Cyanobacterium aponinum]PHV63492.1 endonuclease [Cyanobacterium aponinum IPPAS B-1201]
MTDFYLPYNKQLIPRAKELRQNMTMPEKKLWSEYLRHNSFKFMKQRPINNFIVDFYCAKAKLIIEIDGDTHFTNDGIAYDLTRTAILESYGLKVIRFTNHDVIHSFEGVCQAIEKALEIPPPPLNKGASIQAFRK